jgi:hypothetical protein
LGAQSLGANLGLRTSFCRTRAQGLGELACCDHGDVKSSPIAVSVPEACEIAKAQQHHGRRRELYFLRDKAGVKVDFAVPMGPAAWLW